MSGHLGCGPSVIVVLTALIVIDTVQKHVWSVLTTGHDASWYHSSSPRSIFPEGVIGSSFVSNPVTSWSLHARLPVKGLPRQAINDSRCLAISLGTRSNRKFPRLGFLNWKRLCQHGGVRSVGPFMPSDSNRNGCECPSQEWDLQVGILLPVIMQRFLWWIFFTNNPNPTIAAESYISLELLWTLPSTPIESLRTI